MKEKIKIEGFIECSEDEFELTPKEDKLSVCFGEKYIFIHFRRKGGRFLNKERTK